MNKPKIILLTGQNKTELLQLMLNQTVDIVSVVIPDSRKYESLYTPLVHFATENNIPFVITPAKKLDQVISNLQFDVLFSCGYPFYIPQTAIKRAKYAINFHPTLLPKHRGRYVHWVLIDRDEYSGVTAHIIDDGYDTGPIIDQLKFKVSAFDTVNSLLRKSREVELDLMKIIIAKILNGKISFFPQDENAATEHFDKRTPEDSRIDPSSSLSDLFYEIRSCDPDLYPAFFEIDGEKVGIKLFRLNRPDGEEDMI